VGLRGELVRHGNWLFKRRSYLPLLILPILLAALRHSDWLERLAGDAFEDGWEVFCLLVSLAGLAIRCITVGYAPAGTSGRNTKGQKAKALNITGMYSIVRHPLYLGNLIIGLGMVLFVGVGWFALIAILAFWLYYERIMAAEEEFLEGKFGDCYLHWAERTPAILPKFRNWQRPNLPFSVRNVLKREYSGFFLIAVSFPLLDIGEDVLCGSCESNWGYVTIFLVGLAVYVALRTLKKKTRILHVEGR
jgi:protein-S-isoprenylcysteine O-methyltransferase Ste14